MFLPLFLCLASRVSMETGAAFVLPLLWANRCPVKVILYSPAPFPFWGSKEEVGAVQGLTGGLGVA